MAAFRACRTTSFRWLHYRDSGMKKKKKTQQKDDKQLNNFGTNTGLNKNYLYLSQSKLGNFSLCIVIKYHF